MSQFTSLFEDTSSRIIFDNGLNPIEPFTDLGFDTLAEKDSLDDHRNFERGTADSLFTWGAPVKPNPKLFDSMNPYDLKVLAPEDDSPLPRIRIFFALAAKTPSLHVIRRPHHQLKVPSSMTFGVRVFPPSF